MSQGDSRFVPRWQQRLSLPTFTFRPVIAAAIFVWTLSLATSPAQAQPDAGDGLQQLVKSVEFRRNPSDPNYVVTTRTYLIERVQLGQVTRAAFKQTVTDSTGYQMKFGAGQVDYYYYRCGAGEIANGYDSTGDRAGMDQRMLGGGSAFLSYAAYRQSNPRMPFADQEVTDAVCGG